MRNNQPVTSNEHILPDGEVMVTRTDLDGVITYANDAFVASCGFSREELLGQPQNIVRHPDMPAQAFADLWHTIQSGRPWSALVKNRRKDGGFYWARANVSPMVQGGRTVGYMSVRTRPARAEVEKAETAYRAMQAGAAGVKLLRGKLRHNGVRGLVERAVSMSFFARSLIASSGFALAFAAVGLIALSQPASIANLWLELLSLGGVVASVVFGVWATLFLGRPLDEALVIATQVSVGDLTRTFPDDGDPELQRLWRMLDQMNAKLIGVLKDVHASAASVGSSVGGIATGNDDLAQRTDQQATALEETAASMEQLTGTVRQNAENARQADKLAAGASSVAVRGGTAVAGVVQTMSAISDSSRRIADIIGVIEGIAFQTNILALNAAVEAARAGEQGKGFAVVAAEVRSLAQRSASAAKEIKGLIDASVRTVEAGARQVDAAGSTMNEIVDAVKHVTAIMSDIANASDEQSRGIEQVNAAVEHMDRTTQHNARLVEHVASATRNLSAQMLAVSDALAAFQLGSGKDAVAQAWMKGVPEERAGHRPAHLRIDGARATAPRIAASHGRDLAAARAPARLQGF